MGIKIFAQVMARLRLQSWYLMERLKKKFTGWMPLAHWSFFKVLKIKVYEILSSKFEQGVRKHEWQVADLQNVISSSFWTWCYQQTTQTSRESKDSHTAVTKSWSAEKCFYFK